MKTTILAFIAAAALIISCSKAKQLANINVDIPYSQQVSVPPVTGYSQTVPLPAGGTTLSFPSVPFATNSQQYLSQYNTAANLIISVDLKSLNLQILAPPAQNFNFMDNVEVYISSTTQPEVLIASQYTIPKGITTLDLTTNQMANLKNYFTDDTIYFRLNTHINALPLAGAQMQISSVFHLLANPLQ
jgi:hypothetical protein